MGAAKKIGWAVSLGFSLLTLWGCENNVTIPEAPTYYCRWMPTDVGNWWEYQVTVETKSNPVETYKVKYEINETKANYNGRFTYVIEVTKDGSPDPDIMASAYEDACFLERGVWAYLIQDSVTKSAWTQTGLVVDFPLQYRGEAKHKVSAGDFDCRELYLDNANEFKPEDWLECYAENVGLVYYKNDYKEYETTIPNRLIDWRTVTYELLDYKIQH